MAERSHLPGTSYDRLADVIKSYGHLDSPAGPGEVAQILGVDQTEVSRNNAFLVSVGILEQGRKKQLTETGRRLARALEHDVEQDIGEYWRAALSEDEFFQKLVAALRIRRGMDVPTFQTHVAYSAGLSRSARAMTTARSVIDVLQAAGLIQESDGKFVATGATSKRLDRDNTAKTREEPPALPPMGSDVVSVEVGDLPIQLQIQIQCSPDQLEQLPEQLAAFLARLRRV